MNVWPLFSSLCFNMSTLQPSPRNKDLLWITCQIKQRLNKRESYTFSLKARFPHILHNFFWMLCKKARYKYTASLCCGWDSPLSPSLFEPDSFNLIWPHSFEKKNPRATLSPSAPSAPHAKVYWVLSRRFIDPCWFNINLVSNRNLILYLADTKQVSLYFRLLDHP